jgi:hypothetical protein
MESEGLLQSTQEPGTGLYPQPNVSSQHPLTLFPENP